MNSLDDIHASGLKVTAQRVRVLELFHAEPDRHLTAEEVYRRLLLDSKHEIGMATIYRVLMQFVEAGILARIQFEHGPAHFELNRGAHHDHLICTQCGKVEEFVDSVIEQRQQDIARERGFALADHTLALYGQCRDCRAAKAAP